MLTQLDRSAKGVVIGIFALMVAGCHPASDRKPREPVVASTDSVRPDLATTARSVLAALKARDGGRLSAWVHPVKGLRFSPYPHVRSDSDIVLSAAEVAGMFADSTIRHWGYADGSGAPLDWTFNRYFARYVYDLDFAAAPVVRYNEGPAHSGNTPNNIGEAYPGSEWVEFHFPSVDSKYDGMDWRSLWLVFERAGAGWRLVGIVHGSWTI